MIPDERQETLREYGWHVCIYVIARLTFLQNIESTGASWEKLCKIKIHLPLFQMELEKFSLLHRLDHFVFPR